MKTILFLFFFLITIPIAFAQVTKQDSIYYGAPGDSSQTVRPERAFLHYYITYQDTGVSVAAGGFLDSAIVLSYDVKMGTYHRVGLIDVATNELQDTLVGSSGESKMFLVNEYRPFLLKITLINYRLQFPARKGFFEWSGRNE